MAKKRSSSRPTIADVASLAGVGAITVSRALREPRKVSAELRKTIDSAISQLNYIPNLNARALASSRTDVVAVLVPSLTQNVFSDVVRGIYDGLEGSTLRIEIASTRYNVDIEEQLVSKIVRHQPAAIIISGTEQTATTRKILEGAGCPIIQIMDLTADPIQKVIGFSHERAGLEMTRHLVESGYRRVAFLSGWMNTRSKERMLGYRRALEETNIFDPDLIRRRDAETADPPRFTEPMQNEFLSASMGKSLMIDLLERRPDVDAVFCNNDVLSLGALFGCIERGVDVPQRMGIAGFNDFDYMEAAHPPLSSVRIHRWRCGHEAMLAVRGQLRGEDIGEPIVDLGFDIIKRASTDRTGTLQVEKTATLN
jgi:LacI family transcriptional regulator, gluconate utilization system Gnt-I transcriptional repressor